MKRLILTLCLLLGSLPAICQDYEELKAFQNASGQLSTIFRGTEGTKYNILYNGNYYWESKTFNKGNVFFDGKLYKDVLVNIDACSQTVIVSFNMSSGFIALDTQKVLYLEIGGTRFDNLQLMGHSELPQGFYERICGKGVKVYKRVDKLLRSSYESANGVHFIGYTDPAYRNNVLDYFYYDPTYYLERGNGSIVKIKNVNTLMKEFPNLKSGMKRYCNEHKRSAGRPDENKILVALEYLNR